jgi:2-methylfumaryl-CoA isomerase
MTGILSGLTVVEGSAFVAAPLAGMTLAQLGADVIRFDDLPGGLDHRRWPLARDGQSLFWAGLNKGKRSLRVDLGSQAGRELVSAVIAAAGAFLTNFPARGWLSYETLKARREDLIMVHLKGNRDGGSEVDYTVNPATGFPWATGPRNLTKPVNSVLPAWDIAMGELAAVGLLAADRHRLRSGEGQLVEIALSDVAFAVTGHLGRVAEAQLGGATDSPRRDGNYLYGAFGHDFLTRDERYVMVVALTDRQWRALLDVTGTHAQMDKIREATDIDLDTESGRFGNRDLIAAILRPWFEARDLEQVRSAFDGTGVSWGPYQTFGQLVEEDPRMRSELWEDVEQPGIGTYKMPGTPLDFSAVAREPVRRAPILGEHTEEILVSMLGLSDAEVGRLMAAGTVRGASDAGRQ